MAEPSARMVIGDYRANNPHLADAHINIKELQMGLEAMALCAPK